MLRRITHKINGILIVLIMLIILLTKVTGNYSVEAINNYNEDISWLIEKPIAHRGLYNKKYPENSMGAFANAIRKGYPIELDVRFTKDKEVVVMHDDNLKRLTGDTRSIKDVTYDELRKLKLLHSDEYVPLFKDVLNLIDARVPILIEIKSCENVIELSSDVNKLLKWYDGKYAIQSFDLRVIQWYSENAPKVLSGILISDIKSKKDFNIYNKFILNNSDKTNFISVSLDVVRDEKIQNLGKLGCPILVWTVQSKSDEARVESYADNFIFDKFIPKHY